MKLFDGEQKITTGTNVMLTNYRVSVASKEWWGDTYTIYLFLEDISSIQILFKSTIALLLLGCGSFFVALILSFQSNGYGSPSPTPLFIFGIVLIAAWWFSKRHIISVTPNGGKALEIMIKNLPSADIEKFLYDIQEAKFCRFNDLNKIPH